MSPTNVLLQVFLSSERLRVASIAVGILTVQLSSHRLVLFVNFSLVTKQSSAVSKTSDFVASRFATLVWSLMLVHVFAVRRSVHYPQLWMGLHLLPFARSPEDRDLLGTFWV